MEENESDKAAVRLPDLTERAGVLAEAAQTGRLTRLNEYVVESVAAPTATAERLERENTLHSSLNPSDFLKAINEAAVEGKLRSLEPVVVENFKERKLPAALVEETPITKRKKLEKSKLSIFLEEQGKALETPLERAERIKESIDNVSVLELKPIPIKSFNHVRHNIPLRVRENVAKTAAHESEERTIRMKEHGIRRRERCQCPHCRFASPFQTQFYKQLQKEEKVKKAKLMPHTIQEKEEEESSVEKEEEEEIVDEKLLKLRQHVKASIKADEERRKAEEEAQAKAAKTANINAARAILETSLFQPKPVVGANPNSPETMDQPKVVSLDQFHSDDQPWPQFGKPKRTGRAYDENDEQDLKEKERLELEEEYAREDMRQLNELYAAQRDGQKVDEERIYELELFDRFRRGGYMSEEETSDFEFYSKRKIRTDKFTSEYEDLIYRQQSGEVIDEVRAYKLELIVRKRVFSQGLAVNEMSEMLQFEAEEREKDGLGGEEYITWFSKTIEEKAATLGEAEENDDLIASALHDQTLDESPSIEPLDNVVPDIASTPRNQESQLSQPSSENDSKTGNDMEGTEEELKSIQETEEVSARADSSVDSFNDFDDSSLSSIELDELNDLLDLEEQGEDFDESRLYELDIFEKWQSGYELDEEEKRDLVTFRRRRYTERRYRKEFEQLLEKDEMGEEIDEERLYCLQLFARRHIGEVLSFDEMVTLKEFETKEGTGIVNRGEGYNVEEASTVLEDESLPLPKTLSEADRELGMESKEEGHETGGDPTDLPAMNKGESVKVDNFDSSQEDHSDHQDFGDDEDSYGFTSSSEERLEKIARDHEDINADRTQQKVLDEESQNDIEDCSTTPPPNIIKEPSEVTKEEATRLDLSESETPNENAPFNLATHDGDDSPDIESEESKEPSLELDESDSISPMADGDVNVSADFQPAMDDESSIEDELQDLQPAIEDDDSSIEDELQDIQSAIDDDSSIEDGLQDLQPAIEDDDSSIEDGLQDTQPAIEDDSSIEDELQDVQPAIDDDDSSIEDKLQDLQPTIEDDSSIEEERQDFQPAIEDDSSIKDKLEDLQPAIDDDSSIEDKLQDIDDDSSVEKLQQTEETGFQTFALADEDGLKEDQFHSIGLVEGIPLGESFSLDEPKESEVLPQYIFPEDSVSEWADFGPAFSSSDPVISQTPDNPIHVEEKDIEFVGEGDESNALPKKEPQERTGASPHFDKYHFSHISFSDKWEHSDSANPFLEEPINTPTSNEGIKSATGARETDNLLDEEGKQVALVSQKDDKSNDITNSEQFFAPDPSVELLQRELQQALQAAKEAETRAREEAKKRADAEEAIKQIKLKAKQEVEARLEAERAAKEAEDRALNAQRVVLANAAEERRRNLGNESSLSSDAKEGKSQGSAEERIKERRENALKAVEERKQRAREAIKARKAKMSAAKGEDSKAKEEGQGGQESKQMAIKIIEGMETMTQNINITAKEAEERADRYLKAAREVEAKRIRDAAERASNVKAEAEQAFKKAKAEAFAERVALEKLAWKAEQKAKEETLLKMMKEANEPISYGTTTTVTNTEDREAMKSDLSKAKLANEDIVKLVIIEEPTGGDDVSTQLGPEITHEDWFAKMENVAMSETYAEEQMYEAINKAKQQAEADNAEIGDHVDAEMRRDVEAIRSQIVNLSKTEAVHQILQTIESDSRRLSTHPGERRVVSGKSSYNYPGVTPDEEIEYIMTSFSGVKPASKYELRSYQTSGQYDRLIAASQRGRAHMKRNRIKRGSRMEYISWQSDPIETYSDWEVRIKHRGTTQLDVYSLHRNVLGYGARKSGYFEKQFMEADKSEESPQVTHLDLPKAWANIFPMVLDFMYYNNGNTWRLTAERACALYRWAQFLEIPTFQKTMSDFYNKNVSLKNFATFMTYAVQMKADQLIIVTKSRVGSLVSEQPHDASRLAPKFLARVLEVNRMELRAKAFNNPRFTQETFKRASYQWSIAVHSCVSKNKDGMNKRLFQDLTSEAVLPAIDPSVALPMLVLDNHFHGNQEEYTSFQSRCVNSIVANWDSFKEKFSSIEKLTTALQTVSSTVLAEILIMSQKVSA